MLTLALGLSVTSCMDEDWSQVILGTSFQKNIQPINETI